MGDLQNLRVSGEGAAAWAFLAEGFTAPPTPSEPSSWEGCLAITDAYEVLDCQREAILRETLQVSALDRQLAGLGGDPLRDWRSFRPLALGREESWSDWLAYLLEGADTEFLQRLFRISDLPKSARDVHREQELLIDDTDRSKGNYRSDILVQWSESLIGVHVEVKCGDSHLEKTWAEARHLRIVHGGTWHHFLLVLPKQKREAKQLKDQLDRKFGLSVAVITWEDVEHELRSALLRQSSPRSWCGIARGFAGALGQIMLRRRFLGRLKGETDGA
jgi:hypothetical protein